MQYRKQNRKAREYDEYSHLSFLTQCETLYSCTIKEIPWHMVCRYSKSIRIFSWSRFISSKNQKYRLSFSTICWNFFSTIDLNFHSNTYFIILSNKIIFFMTQYLIYNFIESSSFESVNVKLSFTVYLK